MFTPFICTSENKNLITSALTLINNGYANKKYPTSLVKTVVNQIKNYKNNFFSRKSHCTNCLQIRQQLLSTPVLGQLHFTMRWIFTNQKD